MTLEQEIQKCEAVAERETIRADRFYMLYEETAWDVDKWHAESCMQCAEEHRQLALWLRHYKELLSGGDNT